MAESEGEEGSSSIIDSPPTSPGASTAERKRHRKLMYSAMSYHKMIEGGPRKRVKDEEGEEMFLKSLSAEDPFSTDYDGKSGLGAYANPYIEVFNVAMATAGIYPFKTKSEEDKHRLNRMINPSLYTDSSSSVDDTSDKDLKDGSSGGGVTELTEISRDVVQKVSVTRHLGPRVVTEVQSPRSKVAEPIGGDELPSMMKLLVRQAVDTQMEVWRKEGRLKDLSKEAEEKMIHQLQEKSCTMLASKIQDYVTGEIKFNQPLPTLEIEENSKKVKKRQCFVKC